MKSRGYLVVLLLIALAIAGLYYFPAAKPSASAARDSTLAQPLPGKSKREVAIEDGKTIDFSSGAPIVKDDQKQKAAIEKSLKEMDAAARGVTFGPPKTPANNPPAK
jgi:hypothetical protein